MDIAVNNSQVRYILTDRGVKVFYKKLLGKMKTLSGNANIVKRELEKDE